MQRTRGILLVMTDESVSLCIVIGACILSIGLFFVMHRRIYLCIIEFLNGLGLDINE